MAAADGDCMQESFGDYFRHYTELPQMLFFWAVAFGTVLLCLLIIRAAAGSMSKRYYEEDRPYFIRDEANALADRYYELLFSGTSILLFISVYFQIEFFLPQYREFWNKWSGLFLLGFIVLSVLFNSFLDHVIVPLRICEEERASIRLVGMIYMIVIFAYIKFIYEDNNYDTIIMYYIGLVIGRFVYFDATWKGFKETIAGAVKDLPLLALALGSIGIMALYGFETGYLLKSHGVVVSLFISHLVMNVAILIYHRTHLVDRMTLLPETENQEKS